MKLETLILAVFLNMLILTPISTTATTTAKNCSDGYAWENITWVFNNTKYEFNSVPVYCPYNCSENSLECSQPMKNDPITFSVIVATITLIAFIFIYIAKNITMGGEKFSWILQVFFLFGGIMLMVIDIGIMSGAYIFTETNIAGIMEMAYMGIVFWFITTLLIFLVFVIIWAVKSMMGGKSDEKK